MKIRHKLLLVFVSIAVLIAIVGYTSSEASQKVLCDNIGKSSAVLVANILDTIDEEIQAKIEVFQEYRTKPLVRQVAAESNREFQEMNDVNDYIGEMDRQWVAALDTDITPFMQNLIDSKLSGKFREKIAFYNSKYGSNAVGEIFITNKYGVNAAQSGKTSDYLQADEQWWQDAKRDGLAVRDVDYDLSSQIYSISICTRINDDAGNFIGVMKSVVNINDVIKRIRAAKQDNCTFKLLTKDGRTIYSTSGSFYLFERGSDKLLSSFYEKQKHHKLYAVMTGEGPDKEEKLLAHAHSKGYKDYKGLGWLLVVEYNTKDIFAPVAGLQANILIITAIITAAAIVFGLFISGTISKSITGLAAAAEKIHQGNLDVEVKVESKDEIGQLAASFNKIVDDLKKRTTSKDEMDSEIAERKKIQARLHESMEQLRKHNLLYVEHREQIVELEKKINKLLAELGREPEYQGLDTAHQKQS